MLELVQEEKVQDSIRGYGKVKVFIPSLALLSQIVGLRFVFHHDMESICRDSSWFDEDSEKPTKKIFGALPAIWVRSTRMETGYGTVC